jgi:hypothetical protein
MAGYSAGHGCATGLADRHDAAPGRVADWPGQPAQALAEIEALPHLPGGRWERERRLVGFSEGQISAELARRWNFPMQIVQALERAYDPLVEQAFSRLGAVLNLAGLLADTPAANAETVDDLPHDVIKALGLDVRWLKATFPPAESVINVS